MKITRNSIILLPIILCLIVSGFAILVIFIFLFKEASSALISNSLYIFLFQSWEPQSAVFGFLEMIISTLLVVGLSLFIVTPLAFLLAVNHSFYATRFLAKIILNCCYLIAMFPPVVLGLIGLLVITPFFGSFVPPGFGLLSSSLVLAIILLPYLTLQMIECFQENLDLNKKIILNLGIKKVTYIKKIILTHKKIEIVRAIFLTACRGLSETLAVLMVSGNVIQIPKSLFASFRTVNSHLALEIPYAMGLQRSALFVGALLILTIIVFIKLLVANIKR